MYSERELDSFAGFFFRFPATWLGWPLYPLRFVAGVVAFFALGTLGALALSLMFFAPTAAVVGGMLLLGASESACAWGGIIAFVATCIVLMQSGIFRD